MKYQNQSNWVFVSNSIPLNPKITEHDWPETGEGTLAALDLTTFALRVRTQLRSLKLVSIRPTTSSVLLYGMVDQKNITFS